ncbi:MrcB family domain-containing protein [Paenibacillus sp. GCM10012306]|uniref:MrcB family domain-containing protein n=1 Tax=Paenibacillus sp. GCM10012306 TaxID=3317342 RepID=UPI00360646DE
MPLPESITQIFKRKQKSYKMVLILALIEELRSTNQERVSFDRVKERFLNYFIAEQERGSRVDQPPGRELWRDASKSQLKDIINSPVSALSQVLFVNSEDNTIGFHSQIQRQLGEEELSELERLANDELEAYNSALQQFSLQGYLEGIMSEYTSAKRETFAGHSLGTLFRQTLPSELRKLPFLDDQYKIQGSVGQGNWATVPWLAILDKRITETTQRGEYVVYLFAEDMSAVYLTFNQGVTVPIQEMGRREGYNYLRNRTLEIRDLLPLAHMKKDEDIHLVSSGLGQDYQVSTVAYIKYERGVVPNDAQLIRDLENIIEDYRLYVDTVTSTNNEANNEEVETLPQQAEPLNDGQLTSILHQIQSHIRRKGFFFPEHLIENFYLSLKTKPFVILAGISGTGKTRLVKLFAEALGATGDNSQFTLIPVRPDWSDPADLLGYKDLSGWFKPGPLTEVLVEARKPENGHKPYFICLDEMNLARVEHYFSDLLSVLETQDWQQEGKIRTQDLISSTLLDKPEDQVKYGSLGIPENVFLIGTVNMDETTHPFSKKVLDRANTLEFNYINLQQYPDMKEQEDAEDPANLAELNHLFLRSDYLQLVDAYDTNKELVVRTTERLVKINALLEDIHAHVGFRVRDAICFYMIYNDRYNLMGEEEAFDWQLLQKILPRIQGSHSTVRRVLLNLMKVALGTGSDVTVDISKLMDDVSPLYMKWAAGQTPPTAVHPQSARKLAFMLRRLEEDGFTSYWLS